MDDLQRGARVMLIRASVAITLSVVATALASPMEAAEPANQCWSPQELRSSPGEDSISRGLSQAYVRPPVVTYGASNQEPHIRGKIVRRVKLSPGDKSISLTFDLCEQPYEVSGYQGQVVDYLRENNIPATFFVGGKWMATHQKRASQIVADPLFEIGNHSWTHRNFQVIDKSMMVKEIGYTQITYKMVRNEILSQQCLDRTNMPVGRASKPELTLFRFPFGACTAEAIEEVGKFGLTAIQWDVSSGDPSPGQSSESIVKEVVSKVRPGSIVLFHANGRGWNTAAALPRLVETLRARGFEFRRVEDLLNRGEPVVSETCYDSRPGDVDRYKSLALSLEGSYRAFEARFGARSAAVAPVRDGVAPHPTALDRPNPKLSTPDQSQTNREIEKSEKISRSDVSGKPRTDNTVGTHVYVASVRTMAGCRAELGRLKRKYNDLDRYQAECIPKNVRGLDWYRISFSSRHKENSVDELCTALKGIGLLECRPATD